MKISSKWKEEYLAPFGCISSFKNTLQILTCQDIKEPLFQWKEARKEGAEFGTKMDGWVADTSVLYTVVLFSS